MSWIWLIGKGLLWIGWEFYNMPTETVADQMPPYCVTMTEFE